MTTPRYAALVLVAHAALLAWAVTRHSPTNDEVAHLAAGVSHWHFGEFDLYPVNPPLVRMVAAVPVVCDGPASDWGARYDGLRPEWAVGTAFIRANGERSFWYFTIARWACIPFSLLGGYVCYRWARELYGPLSGALAVTLWCFSPNVLAHGQLITPDLGGTALGVAAGYAFWHWLRRPGWTAAAAAGGVLGLAVLAKTTLGVLGCLWPVVWVVYRWGRWGGRSAWAEGGQLAAALLASLYVLNLGYGFEGSFRTLGSYTFVSATFRGPSPGTAAGGEWPVGNRFAGTWAGKLPVPLPKHFVLGIDRQKYDFEVKGMSYLRGEWKDGGWWYYYLYALAVKVPLGTWLLALGAVAVAVFARGWSPGWRDEAVVLIPACAILVLVSAQTGFNRHLRYVLPFAPFALVWVSRVALVWGRSHVASIAAAGALAWSVASSLAVYPHSLSYFNELAGGPRGGHAHLLHSNIDWGQDLFHLRRWVDEHPEARPLRLTYGGGLVDPRLVGLDLPKPPPGPVAAGAEDAAKLGPQPGWYAVGVNDLRAAEGLYAYFLEFEPVATAGYSIYVYHITPEDADRVRARLGLPPSAP